MNLVEYVSNHAQNEIPTEPVADVHFFKVSLKDKPTVQKFEQLIQEHKGIWCEQPDFDTEVSYIQLGGWLGSQEIALRFMALGNLLGVFELYTPLSMLGESIPEEVRNMLAGSGMVTVKRKQQ